MQVSDEVLRVLSGLQVMPQGVRIVEQLDRKLYTKTNEVLEALGGKWDRKSKSHVFSRVGSDPGALIDDVILTGEVSTHKDLGFFATPPELAEYLVNAAGVRIGHFCLEPSAGEGALVDAMLVRDARVFAVELDDRRFETLCEKYWAKPPKVPIDGKGWWQATTHDKPSGRGFERVDEKLLPLYLWHDDCLRVELKAPMHRVVMNPPFRKCGLGDHLDHVRWAFNQLGPEGVLVSVLPNGVLFRQDARHKEFRLWCAAQYKHQFSELPEAAFKESGTKVRTCMIKLEKH